MTKEYLLIINPISGNKSGKQWGNKIKELLQQKLFSIDTLYTQYKNHATNIINNINQSDRNK